MEIVPLVTSLRRTDKGIVWHRLGGGEITFRLDRKHAVDMSVPRLSDVRDWIGGIPEARIQAEGANLLGESKRFVVLDGGDLLFYDNGSLSHIILGGKNLLVFKTQGSAVLSIAQDTRQILEAEWNSFGRVDSIMLGTVKIAFRYSTERQLISVKSTDGRLYDFKYRDRLLCAYSDETGTATQVDWQTKWDPRHPEYGFRTVVSRCGDRDYEIVFGEIETRLICTTSRSNDELSITLGDGFIASVQSRRRQAPWCYLIDLRRNFLGR